MPDQPKTLHEVLCEEYKTLRPDSDFASGDLPELFARIHKEPQPLSALCISGGGIRSATFALGAIQGLAEHGLLDQFDYLSTVSGGGYVGSWLSAWVKRAGGLKNVIPRLRRNAKPPGPGEPDPINHLREYNNYLTPRLGALSADTWTVAATVGRNIILNWLVLVPLLMFALLAPRLLLSVARLSDAFAEIAGTADPVAHSVVVTIALPLLSGLLLAFSIFNTGRYLPDVGGTEHTQVDFLGMVLAPLVGSALCFCAFDALYFLSDEDVPITIFQTILWVLIPSAAGWLAYLIFCRNSLKQRLNLLLGSLSIAVLLMSACTGTMVWLLTKYVLQPTTWAQYVTIAPPLIVISFDLGGAMFVGLSSRILQDDDREWMARASAWTQLFCLSWAFFCGLVLLAPGWAFQWQTWGQSLLAVTGGIGGWASSRGGRPESASAKKDPGAMQVPTKYLLKLAPAAFVVAFVVGLSVLTNLIIYYTGSVFTYLDNKGKPVPFSWWDHDILLEHTQWGGLLLLGAILFALSWIMARYININKFSLHDMYRNRLIRAYLGASNPKRNSSKFTGFAQTDNIKMAELRTGFKPLHVVNIALNLVSGERLAWQQRKAQSFTVSPLFSGNYELGYRDSAEYGSPTGITLGTAVTISGAAATPSMGYHSSPIVGLIMTMFNARLGAWLGNPGAAGQATWKQSGPRSATGSLIKEAFGLTTNKSSYVYLSDGGHFENLALYEMVLRRCRHIVVLDSGCDAEFHYEDLGNALRKIRIDLNIPIEFADDDVAPLRNRTRRAAVAAIRYSEVDGECPDGVLIYIKPMLLGNEPPDVESYAADNAVFPHESTGDQWFNESQTESYRMLGLYSLENICAGWSGGGLDNFARHVANNYLRNAIPRPQAPAKAASA